MDLFGKFVDDTNPAGEENIQNGLVAPLQTPWECWYIDFMQYQIAGDNQVSSLNLNLAGIINKNQIFQKA